MSHDPWCPNSALVCICDLLAEVREDQTIRCIAVVLPISDATCTHGDDWKARPGTAVKHEIVKALTGLRKKVDA